MTSSKCTFSFPDLPAIFSHQNKSLLIAYLQLSVFQSITATGENISATKKKLLISYENIDSGVSCVVHNKVSNMT